MNAKFSCQKDILTLLISENYNKTYTIHIYVCKHKVDWFIVSFFSLHTISASMNLSNVRDDHFNACQQHVKYSRSLRFYGPKKVQVFYIESFVYYFLLFIFLNILIFTSLWRWIVSVLRGRNSKIPHSFIVLGIARIHKIYFLSVKVVVHCTY